jgi:hypothetical protein
MRSPIQVLSRVHSVGDFLSQHLAGVLWSVSTPRNSGGTRKIEREEEFWLSQEPVLLDRVHLANFRVSDWFPRAPGVYWSEQAAFTRRAVWRGEPDHDYRLGKFYRPLEKMSLIEQGGIGSIRLLPKTIDGEECWFATAVSNKELPHIPDQGGMMDTLSRAAIHAGVPLAIPHSLLRRAGVTWGNTVSLEGHVRTLDAVGLTEISGAIHHATPLIVHVEKIERKASTAQPMAITPVALLTPQTGDAYESAYTYVTCSDRKAESAETWIKGYAELFDCVVATNYDQVCPVLADAPLSYQRLLANKHDKEFAAKFGHRVEKMYSVQIQGSGIVNIDSVLNDVSQLLRD